MATHQLSQPEIGYIDPRRAVAGTDPDSSITDAAYDAYKSNDSLDDVLSDKGYSEQAINGMTQNDKVFAVRMMLDGGTPNFSSVSPSSGPSGTEVTLTGANLLNVAKITFDGIPGTSLDIVSGTEVTVVVPAGHTDGTVVDVTAYSTEGQHTALNAYTYSA